MSEKLMDAGQLQQWLSKPKHEWVYFFRTTGLNGEVLLLILNYNGHELARKVFKPQVTDWDQTFMPNEWIYPLPEEDNFLDVEPAADFTFFIDMQDFEHPSPLVSKRTTTRNP
ncbi:hypothetical protein [Serratia liquefaciens]|uniref:hypothetical protein n=1 Tax=Serratia liquefaciens TaxID=614 RepID=UPI0039AF704F